MRMPSSILSTLQLQPIPRGYVLTLIAVDLSLMMLLLDIRRRSGVFIDSLRIV